MNARKRAAFIIDVVAISGAVFPSFLFERMGLAMVASMFALWTLLIAFWKFYKPFKRF